MNICLREVEQRDTLKKPIKLTFQKEDEDEEFAYNNIRRQIRSDHNRSLSDGLLARVQR